MIIETKRLRLAPLKSFDNFKRVYSDELTVKAWSKDEITEDKLKEKFEKKTEHWKSYGFGVYEVYLKTGEFVGLVGVEKENDYVKVGGLGLSEFHGKFGLAVEAMQGLLKYSFDHDIARELIAYTYETNIIPQKMMRYFGGYLYYTNLYKGERSLYYKITKQDFSKMINARFK